MTQHTVLGAGGFIGAALQRALPPQPVDFSGLRGQALLDSLRQQPLGTLYYCIGMTANFRQQPFATLDANLLLLRQILEHCEFEQLIYLSSTRVYAGLTLAEENQPLLVRPDQSDQLYNLSKLMAENLCLSSGRACKIVRLSNIYGAGMRPWNFLASVLLEAARTGAVTFQTSADSVKDYLSVDDAVRYLLAIADGARYPVYNLASGSNVSNGQIAAWLSQLGVDCRFAERAPVSRFPDISVARLQQEFGQPHSGLAQALPQLLQHFRRDAG